MTIFSIEKNKDKKSIEFHTVPRSKKSLTAHL